MHVYTYILARELFELALVRARPRSARWRPVRACPHLERLNSTGLRPREPARILDAEATFVRARSHSRRRGQTLVFFQCTPVYVPVYASVRSSVRPSVRWAFVWETDIECTCGH